MRRILASLFPIPTEPLANSEQDNDPVEPKTEEQMEAIRDLDATYNHPIKCSHQINSKKFSNRKNSVSILRQRENGIDLRNVEFESPFVLHGGFLPEEGEVIASMEQPTFCGQFSDDGQRFISACQDHFIRLYDTSSSRTFTLLAEIEVEEVGWSILDTALAPDRSCVAYSTWSECIYLVKLDGNHTIIPLNLKPHSHNFSIFSLQFSVNGSEIICGSNDACVYIYDLEKNKRTLRVEAHQNDVNAVRFIDNSNSLIVSGSDDGLVLVWDRRALNEAQPKPVGIFAGHTSGITFVHNRMDTRYLISNCKDQTIKLWDMRRFANDSTIHACRLASNAVSGRWDYRVGPLSQIPPKHEISGDPSVCTYRGHSVGYTLIRCYFSPAFTTGQRYIISGSSNGCIYIYDVLTGATERRLCIRNNSYGPARDKCVRDVSWHPYDNYIISTSWDNRRAHVRWTHKIGGPTEPCLSPPVQTKSTSVQVSESSPTEQPLNTLSTLQQLWIQRFSSADDTMDSENDESPDD